MATVAQYFAQVGTEVDTQSLSNVNAYFNKIEGMASRFQRRMQRGGMESFASPNIGKMRKSFASMSANLSKAFRLRINNVSVNRKALNKAFDVATKGKPIKIEAALSKSSVVNIRKQLEGAFAKVNIRGAGGAGGGWGVVPGSPIANRSTGGVRAFLLGGNVAPQYHRESTGGKFLDPRNTRRQSPWHNPMMVGGGFGAFLRYGLYSLPFVGGTLGMGALSRVAEANSNLTAALNAITSLPSSRTTSGEHLDFIDMWSRISNVDTKSLLEMFTPVLSAGQGKGIETDLQDIFRGFSQYAIATGKRGDLSNVTNALANMISKGTLQRTEVNQLDNLMKGFRQALADVVSGGDLKELDTIMKARDLKVEEFLLPLSVRLDEMSRGAFEDRRREYVGSREAAGSMFVRFIDAFLDGGAEKGMNNFWRVWSQNLGDMKGFAESLGRTFGKVVTEISKFSLSVGEVFKWQFGTIDEDNPFFQKYGESSGWMKEMFESLAIFSESINTSLKSAYEAADNLFTSFSGYHIDDSLLMWLKAVIESVGVIVEMFGHLLNQDLAAIRETWGRWQARSIDLQNQALSRRSARQSMIRDYDDDTRFWPPGEFDRRVNKRYEEITSTSKISDVDEEEDKTPAGIIRRNLGLPTTQGDIDRKSLLDYIPIWGDKEGDIPNVPYGSEVPDVQTFLIPEPKKPLIIKLQERDKEEEAGWWRRIKESLGGTQMPSEALSNVPPQMGEGTTIRPPVAPREPTSYAPSLPSNSLSAVQNPTKNYVNLTSKIDIKVSAEGLSQDTARGIARQIEMAVRNSWDDTLSSAATLVPGVAI